MNNKYQEDILLCRAIQRLDKELRTMNIKPIELNVCGGFALLLQKVRKNGSEFTDVDYIGGLLPDEVVAIMNQIGMEMNLGSNWINNNVLMDGFTLEDLEYSTGKLHFEPKMELSKIKINVLDKVDLLRMKVIAIDTALCRLSYGGDFTRMKDFEDVKLLMEDLNFSEKNLEEECELYTLLPEVYDLISYYLKTGDKTLCLNKTYAELIEIANKMLDEKIYVNMKSERF